MVLRDTLLYLAQNNNLRNFVISNRATRGISRRFVAGETLDEAIQATRVLNQRGMHVSLDHLGENVSEAKAARSAAQDFVNALATRSEVVNFSLTLYRSFRAWEGGHNWAFLREGNAMPDDAEARLAVAREVQPEYAERLRLIIRLLREAKTAPVLMTQPTLAGTGRGAADQMLRQRCGRARAICRSFRLRRPDHAAGRAAAREHRDQNDRLLRGLAAGDLDIA